MNPSDFIPSAGIMFVVVIGLLFTVTLVAAMRRYRRCPPNKILVKSGWIGGNRSSKPYHGGATFVWPLIQEHAYLDLAPINTDIDLTGALSKQNIRVSVPSSFTFAIGTTPELMNAAAERLLGQSVKQIEDQAREMIFGQLRATIATMDIEEINGDREKFEKLVMENIETELKKIGLYLINVNISDITDESGYLEALGRDAAARAVNDAKIKVAEKERDGEIGQAQAHADQRKQVADAEAQAISGENEAAIVQANSLSERQVAEAEATRLAAAAKSVADAKARQEAYEAEEMAERQRASRDEAEKYANEVVPAKIAKEALVVAAQASAEADRLAGEGAGKRRQAELEGEAEGLKAIVEAAGGDAQAAALLMIAQQIPTIVDAQAQAISNIDFGEIVVIDGGGANGESGATARFLQDVPKMLPGMHAIAQATGLELPEIFGKLKAVAPGDDTPPDGGDTVEADVVDADDDGSAEDAQQAA